jgi:ribose transport system substrate-binding protein
MFRLPGLLVLGLALAAFCGCNKPSEAPSAQKATEPASAESGKKMTIAVIPKGTIHEFWKTVHAGAVKASRELGVDIIWKAPLREDDREAQIAVVEDIIVRGVSGIVLAPLDEAALRMPVSNAMRAGIPVVIFDSGLQGEDYVSFVATDNYKSGQAAGERMAGILGNKGNVVVLRYSEGSDSSNNRENGFLDAIAKYKDIKVLSSNQYAGVTTESAYKAGENLIARFKNPQGAIEFNGIFCATEPTAFGLLRALEDNGFAGKVKFICFDSSVKLIEALTTDKIHALVLQDPMKIGYMGVKTLYDHLQGKPVAKRIDTGYTLVTKENMNQPEIQALLKPDLDKWLK